MRGRKQPRRTLQEKKSREGSCTRHLFRKGSDHPGSGRVDAAKAPRRSGRVRCGKSDELHRQTLAGQGGARVIPVVWHHGIGIFGNVKGVRYGFA